MACPKLTEEERRQRQRQSSRRYDAIHSEERNKKTRIRMARLRGLDTTRSPEERAARLAARRASDAKYRRNHRALLAANARNLRGMKVIKHANTQATLRAQRWARLERVRARILDRQSREGAEDSGEDRPEDEPEHDVENEADRAD
ncbi:hypothetical protein B0H13DRAFT_2379553 [Mycena leptocephala]|nr:hypothetical protein B0H13DRAFT_2379553 [Mycena leptocephala]